MLSIPFALALLLASKSPAAGQAWPLAYAGQSANEFIWDKRTESLLRSTLPRKFADDYMGGLGGPPDPVYVDEGRYFSTSACVPHACPSKSFFWYDTQTGVALGADYDTWNTPKLVLASRAFDSKNIPAPALKALDRWLGELQIRPDSVDFVGASGELSHLPRADFLPREKFLPPAGGPSFDCAKTQTTVENMICGDEALSAKDLELSRLVAEIRHGTPSTKSRAQLVELQREWLRSRDRCTGERGAIVQCLYRSYDSQHDVLVHWTPKR